MHFLIIFFFFKNVAQIFDYLGEGKCPLNISFKFYIGNNMKVTHTAIKGIQGN